MTIDPQNIGGAGLVDRAKNVLLTPQAEFDRIANEPADVSRIYTGYVLPLVALGAVCGFIGMSFIGMPFFGRTSIPLGLVGAILQIVIGVASVYVVALVTNALAPSFGSQQDIGKAHQLAAYGATAGLLARVFSIFPPLAILSIVGLYSIALFYIGLPRLMKTPEDKRIIYLVVIVAVFIVAALVLGSVMTAVQLALGGVLGGGGGMPGMPTMPSYKPG